MESNTACAVPHLLDPPDKVSDIVEMTQLRPARVNKFMLREFAAWLARGHPEWAGTQQTTMDVWRKLVQWAHVCMAVDVHSDPKNYPLFVAHARDAFTHAGWHLPSKKPPKGTLRFLRPAPLVSPEPFTAATALSYTPAGTCVTPPPPTPPPFASVAAAGGSSTTPCPTPAWQPKYAWQAHNNRDLPADIAPMPLAADESPFLARSRAWVSAYEEADSMLLCSGDDVGGACHFGVLLEPCFAMHETVREDNRAPLAAQLPPPPPPTQPPTDVPPQLPVQQSLSSASSPCNTTTPTADTTTTTTLCDAVPNDGACTPRRCVSSAFVQTLANIVDNAPQDVIAWEPSGDTVVIHDCERLTTDVLTRVFKMSKFNSFLRQLNFYGFRKVPVKAHLHDRAKAWRFSHPYFVRGRRDLLPLINRKTSSAYTEPKTDMETLTDKLSASREREHAMAAGLCALYAALVRATTVVEAADAVAALPAGVRNIVRHTVGVVRKREAPATAAASGTTCALPPRKRLRRNDATDQWLRTGTSETEGVEAAPCAAT